MNVSLGRQAVRAVVFLILFTLLLGVAYPLAVTGITQVLFKDKAEGSLILEDGKAVGSMLIGQTFSDPKYFWGRLSATPAFSNNAAASSGSNYGPSNPGLLDAAKARIEALQSADPGNTQPVPVDLVTSSASGLDPDISVAAAEYQIGRVARIRGVDARVVASLVKKYTKGRQFGILGEPRVNVLELNLALDKLK